MKGRALDCLCLGPAGFQLAFGSGAARFRGSDDSSNGSSSW